MKPSFYLPERLAIRAAGAQDREAIEAFLRKSLAEFDLQLDPVGTDKDIEGLPGSYETGYFGLIEGDDGIKGTFALFQLGPHKAEIRKMYLDPTLRGKGIGKQMLNFVQEVAHEKGYYELGLETSSSMHAARRMYESNGFIEIDADLRTERCDRRFIKNLKQESP